MADEGIKVKATPINQVEIKGAIAFSAEHARVWAEGTDSEVEKLGGEHSSKGWAGSAGEEAKQYTDEQVDAAKTELYGAINTQSVNVLNQAKSYTDTSVSHLDVAKQDVSNLVTSVSSASTDSQYPSAKLFYDTVGDIETLINAL